MVDREVEDKIIYDITQLNSQSITPGELNTVKINMEAFNILTGYLLALEYFGFTITDKDEITCPSGRKFKAYKGELKEVA